MSDPSQNPKTESRLASRMAYVVAGFIAVMFAVIFLAAIYNLFFNERGAILRDHFVAIIGMPVSATLALLLVVVLRQTSGPIEIEGFGFKFKGVSGPMIMWVICFLAMPEL